MENYLIVIFGVASAEATGTDTKETALLRFTLRIHRHRQIVWLRVREAAEQSILRRDEAPREREATALFQPA